MELAIIIVLTLALGTLLFSRIHFHFSFSLAISKTGVAPAAPGARGRLHSASGNVGTPPRHAARNKSGVQPRSPQMAMGTIDQGAVPAQSEKQKSDILSALLNLGCEKGKAIQIAKQAIGQGKDFNSQLSWALQNAA